MLWLSPHVQLLISLASHVGAAPRATSRISTLLRMRTSMVVAVRPNARKPNAAAHSAARTSRVFVEQNIVVSLLGSVHLVQNYLPNPSARLRTNHPTFTSTCIAKAATFPDRVFPVALRVRRPLNAGSLVKSTVAVANTFSPAGTTFVLRDTEKQSQLLVVHHFSFEECSCIGSPGGFLPQEKP